MSPTVDRHGNYKLTVNDERGSPHHLPHGHVLHGSDRVASVFLLSGRFFDEVERLPRPVVAMVRDALGTALGEWERLNG